MESEERLRGIVEASNGGCYGITWAKGDDGRLRHSGHYNTHWLVEGVHQKGLKGLYSTASIPFTVAPGEGAVCTAFAAKRPLLVPDLLQLSNEDVKEAWVGQTGAFLRADLAKEYDTHPAAFLPAGDGTVASGAELPAVPPSQPVTVQDGKASPMLAQLVEASHGGCYGIEWALSAEGVLTCKGYYNPQWCIEGVRKKGIKGLYTKRSSSFACASGQGLVGLVFAEQRRRFVRDVQSPREDDLKCAWTGDKTCFLRADLAKEFDIHSVAFLPSKDGVVEVGSIQTVDALGDLLPEAAIAGLLDRLLACLPACLLAFLLLSCLLACLLGCLLGT